MFPSGRELFLSDASLFVDDAEAYEQYTRDEQPEDAEEKVTMHLIPLSKLQSVFGSMV